MSPVGFVTIDEWDAKGCKHYLVLRKDININTKNTSSGHLTITIDRSVFDNIYKLSVELLVEAVKSDEITSTM